MILILLNFNFTKQMFTTYHLNCCSVVVICICSSDFSQLERISAVHINIMPKISGVVSKSCRCWTADDLKISVVSEVSAR